MRITRTKIKLSKKDVAYCLIIINIIIWAVTYNKTNDFYQDIIYIESASASSEISEEEKKIVKEPKTGTKEWVLWKVEQEGIDPIKVDCLITKESGWNPQARGINTGGSIDLGLYQWNTKYQIDPGYISIGCIGNPECETYKFIEKVKNDKNFGAWHGYTNNCQWLGTNPFIN